MKGSVLPVPDQFECRFCGSTHHKVANNKKLCVACWEEFERWMKRIGVSDKSELAVNRWMARRLMLDAERMSRYGITGRCEAVSSAGNRRWLDGWDAQCRRQALHTREGRKVCSLHATATAPIFVGDIAHDAYTDMQRILTSLAKTDEKFRQCLIAAVDGSHTLSAVGGSGQ